MTEISWRDFRENLADVINRVRFQNERIAITRHGKVVAEIGPQLAPEHEQEYRRFDQAPSVHEAGL